MSDAEAPGSYHGWVPIGATYNMGAWAVLWAKPTDDGWRFRTGSVGLNNCEEGTPGGVRSLHTEGDQ